MKELTEKQGKKAFDLHKFILTLKHEMGIGFITMGKYLKKMRDTEFYKTLDFDSFTSYVENSELGFKRRTAYYYIEIYEWFIEKLYYEPNRLADIGYDKLVRLLPVVKKAYTGLSHQKAKDRVKLLVDDVQELRAYDFSKKYQDKEKSEGHEDYLAPPEYFRCSKCGKWRVIVPTEDCCPEFLKDLKKQLEKKK